MSSNPFTYIVIAIVLIGGFVLLSGGGKSPSAVIASGASGGSNVEIVDGKQIVTIAANGGYAPGSSVAKAGMPTVLRFKTNNSFDCSSSIRIPSLKISQDLPATGTTDIDVGTLTAGTLSGTCSMGMYRFSVEAKS